jgi:DNA repair exonuclease SbcCD ATPase subunit
MSKEIDYLEEDLPLRSQKFCCFSFLSPEGIKNCSIRGLKIRGSYNTYEEAKKRAEQLQKMDPDFHVFVGEVGKWLPWDPDPNSVEDNVYREKELNDLMKEYKKNRERTKEVEGLRKQNMLKKGENDRNKIKERLRKKLEKKKLEKQNLEKNNDVLNTKEVKLGIEENTTNELDNKKENIDKKEKYLENLTNDSTNLTNKLNKIKNLYNKLKDKDKGDNISYT